MAVDYDPALIGRVFEVTDPRVEAGAAEARNVSEEVASVTEGHGE